MGALEDLHRAHKERRERWLSAGPRPARAAPASAPTLKRPVPALPEPAPKVRRAPIRRVEPETRVPGWVRALHRAGRALKPSNVVLALAEAAGAHPAAVLLPRGAQEERLQDAACYWIAGLTDLDFCGIADWLRLDGGASAAREAAARTALRDRLPETWDRDGGLEPIAHSERGR